MKTHRAAPLRDLVEGQKVALTSFATSAGITPDASTKS
jgi:hypothetical protein